MGGDEEKDPMIEERRLQEVLEELGAQNPEVAEHLRRLDELIDGFADLRRKTEISLHRAWQEVERLRAAAS